MHTSEAGIRLIKAFEGFPYGGRPYRDTGGVWTIGYGHTEGVGPNTPRITQSQADALLRHDLAHKYEPYVNALIRAGVRLNQHQYDALVSFVYNLGPLYIQRGHTMGDLLRQHRYGAAANAFMIYDRAGGQVLLGLRRRRAAERALFLKPAQTRDQKLVAAWKARLERVRAEVRRRKAAGKVAWTPGLQALAKELERNIQHHS